MSLTDSLRKGLRFLLMSFGVSSPDKKPKPVAAKESPTQPRK